MIVDWTESAIADLNGVYQRIEADSPYYALTVVDRLTARCKQIAAFPLSGQIVPEYQREDIREVIEYSYRMIYQVGRDITWILAICHGAEPLPDTLPLPRG